MNLLGVAADLLSEHGENPEYDRAIVELTSDLLGISHENRHETETILRGMKS